VLTVGEAAITILMMGAVPIIIRSIDANPWTIGLARLGVATTGMAAVVWPTRRELRALAIIGLLFGAHWALYFISIKVSSAAIAVIGQSTFGVHLVVLGWVIGHHHVDRGDIFAVGCAVAGSLMVAPRWSLADHDTVGLLLGILS
jgi:drug/metabolite transporter (DMT)-like permease